MVLKPLQLGLRSAGAAGESGKAWPGNQNTESHSQGVGGWVVDGRDAQRYWSWKEAEVRKVRNDHQLITYYQLGTGLYIFRYLLFTFYCKHLKEMIIILQMRFKEIIFNQLCIEKVEDLGALLLGAVVWIYLFSFRILLLSFTYYGLAMVRNGKRCVLALGDGI